MKGLLELLYNIVVIGMFLPFTAMGGIQKGALKWRKQKAWKDSVNLSAYASKTITKKDLCLMGFVGLVISFFTLGMWVIGIFNFVRWAL